MNRTTLLAGIIVLVGVAGLLLAQGNKSVADKEKIQSGEKLFSEFQCFVCHGQAGKGGIKNPNVMGGEVPTLAKVAEGYTTEELKKKILEGVPKVDKQDPNGADPPLFMPAWKEVLSEAQVDSLAAYLMSLMPDSEKGQEW